MSTILSRLTASYHSYNLLENRSFLFSYLHSRRLPHLRQESFIVSFKSLTFLLFCCVNLVSFHSDPVVMDLGGIFSFVLVVICVSHLKTDGITSQIITSQIFSTLLRYEFFLSCQQFQNIVQGLTCHTCDLIVCPPPELLPLRTPKPHLLDIIQFFVMPDRHTDKILPEIIVSVVVTVMNLILFPLRIPIIWEEDYAHNLLYCEGLLASILPLFP